MAFSLDLPQIELLGCSDEQNIKPRVFAAGQRWIGAIMPPIARPMTTFDWLTPRGSIPLIIRRKLNSNMPGAASLVYMTVHTKQVSALDYLRCQHGRNVSVQAPRFPLPRTLHALIVSYAGDYPCRILDVSLSGLLIECPRFLDLEDTFRLRIDPFGILRSGSFELHVALIRTGRTSDGFLAGLAIRRCSASAKTLWQDLIYDLELGQL